MAVKLPESDKMIYVETTEIQYMDQPDMVFKEDVDMPEDTFVIDINEIRANLKPIGR